MPSMYNWNFKPVGTVKINVERHTHTHKLVVCIKIKGRISTPTKRGMLGWNLEFADCLLCLIRKHTENKSY